MKTIVVIPARLAATRFPKKPLAKILGMPMIEHCYHRAVLGTAKNLVWIATCDQEIFDYTKEFGGNAVMTADTHQRASDRTAEALLAIEKITGERIDNVLMLQGDEPSIPVDCVTSSVKHLESGAHDIVNVMSKIPSKEKFHNPNTVKVVFTNTFRALYFSREPIPSPWKGEGLSQAYSQVGLIGFSRESLLTFNQLSPTPLEEIESVDMNRVLQHGYSIQMVPVEYSISGVDTPEDLLAAEKHLSNTDQDLRRYLKC